MSLAMGPEIVGGAIYTTILAGRMYGRQLLSKRRDDQINELSMKTRLPQKNPVYKFNTKKDREKEIADFAMEEKAIAFIIDSVIPIAFFSFMTLGVVNGLLEGRKDVTLLFATAASAQFLEALATSLIIPKIRNIKRKL